MNKSFRAPDREVAKPRQQVRMKEKEEELALFLEMRRREKEGKGFLIQNSDEFDAPLGSTTGISPIFNIASATTAPVRKTPADEFLNSENDKNDYEWLLTPPGTPLFPSLEMESRKTIKSPIGSPKAHPTALKSRLANPQLEPTARSNSASRQSASSPGLNTSGAGVFRSSSSGGPRSRPSTPTGRPTLTSTSKPTLASAHKPISTTVSKPSRPLTPSSRPTLTSTNHTVPARSSTPTARSTARSSTPTARSSTPTTRSSARSSTPTARSSAPMAQSSTPTAQPSTSTARSSTPTARPSLIASKPISRAATPNRRPTTLSTAKNASAPPVKSPSSVPKAAFTTVKNPVPPRASSPTVKPRPWKDIPGYSLDAPPNLRTSLSDRPNSASRGRPGMPGVRASSVDPVSNGRIRRQSYSPSRGRAPNGINHNNNTGTSVPAMNRAYAKAIDNVSPVMYGNKMVERVINMRKLMPPKQDDKHSPLSNLSGKSSSPDSSGFGRNLSKKSLDMAIRHMDIRRRVPGNLTNIPASSIYSVRSGHTPLSRTVSVSDSPLGTSSNSSFEVSINNNGIELEDDVNSERGVRSSAGLQGR